MVDSQEKFELDFLIKMLDYYSPSGHESELAAHLFDHMNGHMGLKNVRIDSVGNVLGEIGSGSPVLLLCGHMDTVPGQQSVTLTDGQIYGRGAVDAKASLSSLMMALSRFSKSKFNGKIVMACVVDEEGVGKGVNNLVQDGLVVNSAIFGEPSGIDNITIGYKGRLGLRFLCETSSVHASAPWMSNNAVERILDIWKEIELQIANNQSKQKFASISASLTEIRGGSSHNVTPARCEMTVDIRLPPGQSCSPIISEIERIISNANKNASIGPPSRISMKIEDATEPFEADKNSGIVRAMIRAGLTVRGKRPQLLRKTGTGDMNVLGNALGIPVITFGPGDAHLSHTSKEVVSVDEYYMSIELSLRAIINFFSLKD